MDESPAFITEGDSLHSKLPVTYIPGTLQDHSEKGLMEYQRPLAQPNEHYDQLPVEIEEIGDITLFLNEEASAQARLTKELSVDSFLEMSLF